MRLIDADALMMHLADIKLTESPDERDNSYYKRDRQLAVMVGIEYAEDAVKEAPTVGGWVSVRDRVPENYKEVLAVSQLKNGTRQICMAYCISDSVCRDWATGEVRRGPFWVVSRGTNNIIYWQELPDMPENDPA